MHSSDALEYSASENKVKLLSLLSTSYRPVIVVYVVGVILVAADRLVVLTVWSSCQSCLAV